MALSSFLRLLIFLLANLIPACDSSNPAFHMMYSAYNLNKQGGKTSQFWTSQLFHICVCCFLTLIQVSQVIGKVVWYSHLLKNFPQLVVIHTVKDFSIVNEADVLGEDSLAFTMIQWMLAVWYSAFYKSSFYICKFLVHILLQPSLKDFEHYLASMWNECSCAVVWTLPFFGIVMKTETTWVMSKGLWSQSEEICTG